jgi:hypothetical protein
LAVANEDMRDGDVLEGPLRHERPMIADTRLLCWKRNIPLSCSADLSSALIHESQDARGGRITAPDFVDATSCAVHRVAHLPVQMATAVLIRASLETVLT